MEEGPNGLPAPDYTPGQPPEDLIEQIRWFCSTYEDTRKVPRAPWLDEHPEEGYETSWDSRVGFNWDGVQTDYETAKKWADHIDDWDVATNIGYYDNKETPRIHLLDFDSVRDPETEEVHPLVMGLINALDSYAQVSTSGTGVHIYVIGPVPEEYKETGFEGELEGWKHSDKFDGPPELEGYARGRYIVITGDHIENTPTEVKERPGVLRKIYERYGEKEGKQAPDDFDGAYDREPEHTKTEVRTTEETGNWNIIFDAIAHAKPREAGGRVRLRSKVTNKRSSGILDIDPSWEHSDSGSRLGYDDGFIYRKGNTGVDILQVVALEEHLISSVDQYPEGDDFAAALEELRKRGAHIPEYDPEADEPDPLAILPLARLDVLDHDERVRYAKKRGIEWPDVHDVRERLDKEITQAVNNDEMVVKSSPTGSGKTYTVATKDWKAMPDVTGDQPVVHAHRTREARDQARGMSDDADVDAFTLRGRKELCGVAAGDHDPDNEFGNESFTIDGMPISEWMDHRCERQGIPFSVVHRWAETEVEGDLPCQRDSECAAMTQFDGIPRDDDGNPSHDVIHTTHQFLQVPGLRMHTNVFIDEKPAFGIDLTPQRVRQSVNAYLNYIDAPVANYAELVRASKTGLPPDVGEGQSAKGLTNRELKKGFKEDMDEALNGENTYIDCPICDGTGRAREDDVEHLDVTTDPSEGRETAPNECGKCGGSGRLVAHRGQPPLSWYKDKQEAHALAPAFTRAIWQAEEVAAGRKHAKVAYHPPRFDHDAHDSSAWNRVKVDVVLDDQWEVVEAESIPDFSLANGVIGLDAHPQPHDPFWMANVSPEMETDYTLDTEERTLYRRYERGLFTVQVGHGVQPVTSGEWLDQGQGRKFKALIKHTRQHHGEDFDSAITSIAAKPFVREAMEEAGVDEPEMMHYGNEESRNDFAGKNVGLVVGSIDPGDEKVVNLLARLDMDAEPAHKECPVCDGTGHIGGDAGEPEMCETCNGEGEVRERGRTFEGEDAEVADSVLKGVREHHVAQSAGRWARDAEDPNDHATVFIVSEASPTGFIDAKVPGVTWTTNEAQRERLEYVRDQPEGATAKEVADEFDCSKQAAWRTFKTAHENGLLEKTPGTGPYGADVYSPSDGFTPDGAVDLGSEGTGPSANSTSSRTAYGGNGTYTVTIQSLPHCAVDDFEEERADWAYQSTFEWYERLLRPST